MLGTGTIVNAAAIVAGSLIGIFIKSRLNRRYVTIFFQAAGLFTIFIGISMAIEAKHIMVVGVSLVSGALLGEWLRLDERLQRLGNRLKAKLKMRDERFTEGLLTAFMLYCVGAMAVIGPIEEGLTGKTSDLLLAKAMMDGFSSIMFASVFGWGILFSALPLLAFQGSLTLLAVGFGSFLPQEYVAEVSAVGGVMLVGLGLQIMEVKTVKVANMLPALVIAYAMMCLI
ncbi:MAG: DUF554 domain-containing protein [Prevotellaceae bacterium]|jgi:uncharacterized membrane protein YqgA involved in biofilm formation|nr:DUF554 domain-containing protein [Prevotellaceae bacterium]